MRTWILLLCLLGMLNGTIHAFAQASEQSAKRSLASTPGPLFAEGVPEPPPLTMTNAHAGFSHVLGPGDIVDIKVYQEDELNTHARIESDGTVSMPLLGVVRLGGKNVEQAQVLIRDALEKDYLKKPIVAVTVSEPAKKRFSILGEVKQPGFYTMPENERVTLLQAISMAGGYTVFAHPGRVTIKRSIDGRETVMQVDAKSMVNSDDVGLLSVQPNDTILVNPKRF